MVAIRRRQTRVGAVRERHVQKPCVDIVCTGVVGSDDESKVSGQRGGCTTTSRALHIFARPPLALRPLPTLFLRRHNDDHIVSDRVHVVVEGQPPRGRRWVRVQRVEHWEAWLYLGHTVRAFGEVGKRVARVRGELCGLKDAFRMKAWRNPACASCRAHRCNVAHSSAVPVVLPVLSGCDSTWSTTTGIWRCGLDVSVDLEGVHMHLPARPRWSIRCINRCRVRSQRLPQKAPELVLAYLQTLMSAKVERGCIVGGRDIQATALSKHPATMRGGRRWPRRPLLERVRVISVQLWVSNSLSMVHAISV